MLKCLLWLLGVVPDLFHRLGRLAALLGLSAAAGCSLSAAQSSAHPQVVTNPTAPVNQTADPRVTPTVSASSPSSALPLP